MSATPVSAGTTETRRERFQVAVLGAGLAGTTLATVLARHGVDVVIIDAGTHPRFAVGESTIPYTSAMIRVVAERYNVPELKKLSSFKLVRDNVGSSVGRKRNFGFVLHQEGRAQDPEECNQFVIPKVLQTETHLFRQDSDAWVFNLALEYGAKARLNTRVVDIEIFPERGVKLGLENGGEIHAKYLVDASGPASPVARILGLRDKPTRAQHNTHGGFGHMVNVKPFDETPAGKRTKQPVSWHSGTLHHMFDGGWLWVIPFNNHKTATNHLVSIGYSLDPAKFPIEEGKKGGDYLKDIIDRFPDLVPQFKDAVDARPWIWAPRIQHSSHNIVGDRYCLTAHASGFIDPLFSRGLTGTFEVVNALAWRLIESARTDDWSTEKFRYMEALDAGLFETHDTIVHSAFQSWPNYDVWNAVFRVWALGMVMGTLEVEKAYFDYVKVRDDRIFRERENAKYPGAAFPTSEHYADLAQATHELVMAARRGEISSSRAAGEIFRRINEADYAPPSFGFGNQNGKWLHPTPPTMAKAVKWSKTEAPKEAGEVVRGALAGFIRERIHGHI